MLKAINENGLIKISWLDKIDVEERFFCPECKQEVIFVNATFKIKHFRHKVENNCDPEPETEKHLEMKKFMMENLGWDKNNLEVGLGFARPDLYKDSIAIEVQHSPLTYYKFMERTKNYADNNIYVLWIFDEVLIGDLISQFIKKAHEIYFGRIYVYKEGKIYPLHLSPVQRYVEEFERKVYTDFEEWKNNGFESEYETVGGYWKTLKNTKEKIWGNSINNIKTILKTENNWRDNNFKIARFTDKKFWGDTNDKNKIY